MSEKLSFQENSDCALLENENASMRNVSSLPVENSRSGNTNTRHALKNLMPKFFILATLQKIIVLTH